MFRFSRDANGKAPLRFFSPLLVPLLVFAALVPQVLNFAQHGDPDRQVWNLFGVQTLERLELSLLDHRFAGRGNLAPPSRERIAIIGIDDASLEEEKRWPFPRAWHAALIDRLHKAGARVIGLDIGFDSYQDGREGALSRNDQALLTAIEKAKNVVLVSHLEQSHKDADRVRASFNAPATPIEELDSLMPDLGLSWVPNDPLDGSVRRYPLFLQIPPEKEPLGGFAPLCVAMYEGLVRGDDVSRYHALLRSGSWLDARGQKHALPLRQSTFPGAQRSSDLTQAWTMPLWFWGAQGTFPTYSYSEVLHRWSDVQLHQAFGGRIVLVGATASILKDTFPGPPFPARDGEVQPNELPGVEIHATMAAMLLDGQFLYEQSGIAALWTLGLCTLGASAWIRGWSGPISLGARRASAWWTKRRLPGRLHDSLWLGLYALVGLVPVAAFWSGCGWAFSTYHLWVWATFPMLGTLGSSVGTMLLLFGQESAARRKTQTQMARIVAPDVMEEILAHPEAGYPRSRRVQASVLFTDLENFTAFVETREPEEVVEALNAFLTRMHPVVAAHGGCIDKYIGDSIMAFFGAPLPRADHAAQALGCAIALQDECARFREETGIPFLMRVGVHSGTVLVGSVGSDQQFNYTVIGDTVNLASRLEEKNKEFGSRILCSMQTWKQAPEIARVEHAQTPIRGKADEVEVFIVRGPFGQAPRDALWNGAREPIHFGAERLEAAIS